MVGAPSGAPFFVYGLLAEGGAGPAAGCLFFWEKELAALGHLFPGRKGTPHRARLHFNGLRQAIKTAVQLIENCFIPQEVFFGVRLRTESLMDRNIREAKPGTGWGYLFCQEKVSERSEFFSQRKDTPTAGPATSSAGYRPTYTQVSDQKKSQPEGWRFHGAKTRRSDLKQRSPQLPCWCSSPSGRN